MNAIYVRQSVDKKESLSIEGQIEQCRKLAGEDAKVFKDKGYSGKNTNRPAFTELMREVTEGNVEKIYVYRLDRFSRSIADFCRLWEVMEKNGTAFLSVTEQFDTSSPIGRAMLNIVLVFAQLERETTAERVKDNYMHRFRIGAWGGGPAPYGFDLVKIEDCGRKLTSLVQNDCSEIVKYIFSEYVREETSLRSIAADLKAKGIKGPKRELWDNVTLSRILHSPLYVKANKDVYWYYVSEGMQIKQDENAFDGVHACNITGRRDKSKNVYNPAEKQMVTVTNHIGIIEPDLWLKVQEKLGKNKQFPRANAGKYTWLTGLMKCARCGYAVKVNNFRRENKLRLICSGKSNLSACDSSISVDLRELEEYITDEIDKIFKSTEPIEIVPDTKELSAEILEAERKIERLVNALAQSSEISASYITKEIERLHKERNRLLEKPRKSGSEIRKPDFRKLDFEDKKLVAAELINRILIDGNEVNIEWKM